MITKIVTKIELGRGVGGQDTINISDTECVGGCPLRLGDGRFRCVNHNGDATVIVTGGVATDTLEEFASIAPCVDEF